MVILNIDLNNINLDNNFNEDDPDTIIIIRLLASHTKFENTKHLKKYKWRISVPKVWDPKRWWIFCISEHEETDIEPVFTEGL